MLGSSDLGARSPSGVVTAGPWSPRDSYVAETAVVLDRLTAKVERLERREEALNAQVAELIAHAQQANRFQALAESLRNSREFKLDEMLRQVRAVRERVDVIEGPRSEFLRLELKSLVAADQKLAHLADAAARAARGSRWMHLGGLVGGFGLAVVAGYVAGLNL